MRHCFFLCISLLFAGVLSLYLSGCTSFQAKEGPILERGSTSPRALKPGEKPSVPLKVGLLLPLSGPHQQLGKAFQRAAELSLFEGDGATNIVLVARNPARRSTGFFSLPQRRGSGIFRASVCFWSQSHSTPREASTKATFDVFNRYDPSWRRHLHPRVFTDPPNPPYPWRGISRRLGLKKIAAILPKGSYGKLMTEEIQKFAFQYQLSIDVVGYYDPKRMGNDQQAKEELQGIVNALERDAFQAILIPEGGNHWKKFSQPSPKLNFLCHRPFF